MLNESFSMSFPFCPLCESCPEFFGDTSQTGGKGVGGCGIQDSRAPGPTPFSVLSRQTGKINHIYSNTGKKNSRLRWDSIMTRVSWFSHICYFNLVDPYDSFTILHFLVFIAMIGSTFHMWDVYGPLLQVFRSMWWAGNSDICMLNMNAHKQAAGTHKQP